MRTIVWPKRFLSVFLCFVPVLLSPITSACRSQGYELDAELEEGSTAEPILSGHATYFDSLGFPAGGCGVPENKLESPNFLALNVQDTPGDYESHLPRPIPDQDKIGIWDNGRNCGRWIRVTITKNCVDGINSGEPGNGFCRGGRYEDDEFTGAAADFLVADSCQDGNGWCRDDPFHIDMATSSLNRFVKDGVAIPDVRGKSWTNRKVDWKFIEAPAYKGDIKIGFAKNAQLLWPAIIITQLQRGIHSVEIEVDGKWKAARLNGDNGQAFVLEGPSPFKIRIYDAYDALINGGRMYSFPFPCQGTCTQAYTDASYTVTGGDPSSTVALAPNHQSQKGQLPSGGSKPNVSGQSSAPTSISGSKLKAELRIKSTGDTFGCGDLILTNDTKVGLQNWEISVDKSGATIEQPWNLVIADEGSRVRLTPASREMRRVASGQKLEGFGFCFRTVGQNPAIVGIKP